jgi:hypothetical protein
LRFAFIILLSIQASAVGAQTLGGSATYNFLKLPPSPLLSAVGGVNASYALDDVGLASNNPAFLHQGLHSQAGLSFNSYFAGVKAYNLAGAYHHDRLNTTLGGSVFFIDYGNIPQTDAAGNREGVFQPKDYVMQISAGREYGEKWQYGMTGKFIRSDYGQYRSSGLAFDVGVLYADSARQLLFGLLAKNMGVQLSTYSGQREDLPFDVQVGVTKKLSKAPLGFSVTAHQIHQFDLVYEDTLFNSENNFSSNRSGFNKLFNHFVFATHIYLGNHLQLAIGYNRLRREELNLGGAGNGLNGFSGGINARFRKMHIQYARSYFQRSYAYNQFGLNLMLNQLVGEGRL